MSATRTPFARLGLAAAMAASLSIAAAPAFAQQPATPRAVDPLERFGDFNDNAFNPFR